jgi:hypothetical protein
MISYVQKIVEFCTRGCVHTRLSGVLRPLITPQRRALCEDAGTRLEKCFNGTLHGHAIVCLLSNTASWQTLSPDDMAIMGISIVFDTLYLNIAILPGRPLEERQPTLSDVTSSGCQ